MEKALISTIVLSDHRNNKKVVVSIPIGDRAPSAKKEVGGSNPSSRTMAL